MATRAAVHGTLPSGCLSPLLRRLTVEKRVLAVDEPLTTRPGKPAPYRVAASSLRLYLGVLRAKHERSRRGRPDTAYDLVDRRWSSWRGRAVEPLVRQALELAVATQTFRWKVAEAVGGWWNRRFDPEVDIVGADRSPVARRIDFVGAVKWLATPVRPPRRRRAATTAPEGRTAHRRTRRPAVVVRRRASRAYEGA